MKVLILEDKQKYLLVNCKTDAKNNFLIKTTLPYFLFVLIVFTACKNGRQEAKSCHCKNFYELSNDEIHPLLEFRNVFRGNELGSFINDIYNDTLMFEDALIQLNYSEFQDAFRVNIDMNNRFQHAPQIAFVRAKDTASVMEMLSLAQEKHWLEFYPIRFLWSKTTISFVDDEHEYHALYAVNTEIWEGDEITHKDISDARVSQDPDNGEYGVSLSMTDEGAQKWGNYTQKNVGNFIAIISRNKVLSAPIINGPITGGETLISGGLTAREAEDLTYKMSCSGYIQMIGKNLFEKELAQCTMVKD